MTNETLLTFVSDIVSAHASNNTVSPADLPGLIASVYATLQGLGQQPAVAEEKPEPAVSIRSSVKPDSITCLECGARQKMLKRHLGTHHRLTSAEYKARWGLGADYPLVAPEYAARRRDLAVHIGLGRKPAPAASPAPVARPAARSARQPRGKAAAAPAEA